MPNLISPTGESYRTENPTEVTRLRARGYSIEGEAVVTVADSQFHPGDHGYKEVLAYIEENPADATRVIAEEKAGKRRVSIIGSED